MLHDGAWHYSEPSQGGWIGRGRRGMQPEARQSLSRVLQKRKVQLWSLLDAEILAEIHV